MNSRLSVVVLLCVFVTVCIAAGSTKTVVIRECNQLTIAACQGYGYELTSLNEQEQATAALAIDVLLRIGGSNASPIHTPFLCYSLAPKCRRTKSYDVRPCKEACKQFVSETGEAERRAMRGWTGKLKCNTFKSRRGKSLCVPYKKLLRYAQGKQQQ